MKKIMLLVIATLVSATCYTECYDSDHAPDCVVQLDIVDVDGVRYVISLDHNITYELGEANEDDLN